MTPANSNHRFGKARHVLSLLLWSLSLLLLTAPVLRAQTNPNASDNPVPLTEATPAPSGSYVADPVNFYSEIDPSGNDSVCSASASDGSLTVKSADKFQAGLYGSTWVNVNRGDGAYTIYPYHWESSNGAPPAPYTETYSSSATGTVSQSYSGGAAGYASFSGIGSPDSSGNYSTSYNWTSDPEPGSAYVSVGAGAYIGTQMQMWAHNGSANGKMNASANYSASIQ